MKLYLFLLIVGDAKGLSYYSDNSIVKLIRINKDSLIRAREELIAARLLAYRKPLYQILALSTPRPSDNVLRVIPTVGHQASNTLTPILAINNWFKMHQGVMHFAAAFGSDLGWHPHLHVILLSKVRLKDGTFVKENWDPERLEKLFSEYIFKALIKEGVIEEEVVENMRTWEHSGFSVHISNPIGAFDSDAGFVGSNN